jgi:flagellar hook-associated protein 1 FlgK
MQDSKGNQIDVSRNIVSGKLHGLLAVRDTSLPDFTARLDRMAAQLTRSVNDLHSNGFGLDGSTSTNFFVPRQATGYAVAANTGGGTVQSAAVFDPTQLTLDDYEITFTAAGTFDITNTTTGTAVATAQAYASGTPIQFAGIEVTIADGSGAPQVGDIFQVSSTKDAAKNIALTPEVLNDLEKIAASEKPARGANGTALALARLREAHTIGSSTFGEFQSALVSSIGLTTQEHSLLAEQRQSILTEVENRRESIAGVSLEEEQLDLIRFQQAFGAAANFVRVADEMAQTVLGLVR